MSEFVGEDPADDLRQLESRWRDEGSLGPDDQADLVNSWLLLDDPGRSLEFAERFAAESPSSVAAQALRLRVLFLRDPAEADRGWSQQLRRQGTGRQDFRHYADYLALTGRREAALQAAFEGLQLPRDGVTNLLATAAHIAPSVPGLDPAAFRARFSAAVRAELGSPEALPPRPRARGPLRVGILGCSLHFHPILGFIAPLIQGLDRLRFALRVYSAGGIRDGYQEALRRMSPDWVDVAALDTGALLERLRADRLDVLVELDNHTRDNRLAALARRAAPVQVSLFGLNQTTGLEAIDYRITDAVVDPPGSEAAYTERLLRLPSSHVAYLPFGALPAVKPGPGAQGGRIRLGVFNSWHKIGPGEIGLWTDLLRGIEQLQLVVAGFDDGVARIQLQRRLAEAGIAPGRVEIHPFLAQPRFWSLVQSVDLVLDSYPWGGGATSAAVLSLGVPLLTRTGPLAPSRISASMLLALGMERWVMPVEGDVAGRIVELTADRGRLDALRRPLQEAFVARFCQPQEHAAAVADVLEQACRVG